MFRQVVASAALQLIPRIRLIVTVKGKKSRPCVLPISPRFLMKTLCSFAINHSIVQEETEDDLRALFERFGYIHRVFLGRDRDTNKPKGYACMSTFCLLHFT